MTLLLLALSPAFAVDSIITVRDPAELGTLAVVMSCGEPYTKDSDLLSGVLESRKDIDGLVRFNDATPNDIMGWIHSGAQNLDGAQFHRLLLTVSCVALYGDEDDEGIQTGGGLLHFSDMALGLDKMAESSVLVFDTSRIGYGVTADDPIRLGMHDVFAISSGPPGKFAEAGLIPVVTAVLDASKGGLLTLDDLSKGLKAKAVELNVDLDFYNSRGILTVDQWSGGRQVLKGGGLIAIAPDLAPSVAQLAQGGNPPIAQGVTTDRSTHHLPPGLIVAGGGVAAGIGAGVFGASAAKEYKLLGEYNDLGNTTDDKLNATVGRYHLDTGLTVGLGIGSVALLGTGITWSLLDHGAHPVTITPTGTGVVVGGTF